MDRGRGRGRWKKNAPLWTLLLLTVLVPSYAAQGLSDAGRHDDDSLASPPVCGQEEYLVPNSTVPSAGFCCNKCHPGNKLVKNCAGPGLRSECVKCGAKTYSEHSNYYDRCFRCHTCDNWTMVEVSKCTVKKNTVCDCKPDYYKRAVNSREWECKSCKKSCNKDCPHHCPATSKRPDSPMHTTPSPGPPTVAYLVPICAVVTVLVLVVFAAYEAIRLTRKKKKRLLDQPQSPTSSTDSESSTKVLIYREDPGTLKSESVPFSLHPSQTETETENPSKLPDCVPREIKTHRFIYAVLEVVPVGRFKELARRLEVSEQNIERAEQDHRSFKEAQYQMLKVWSDKEGGGGATTLPRPLLQALVDTLNEMGLGGCGESLMGQYPTQA